MLGLPGDSSSPARFVRAAAYTAALRPVTDGAELERTALHLLNNFARKLTRKYLSRRGGDDKRRPARSLVTAGVSHIDAVSSC